MAAKTQSDRKIPIHASRSLQREGIATVLFLILALVAFESFAEDDKKFYTECAISQGDSVDKVKQFYGIAVDPAKMPQPSPYHSLYHLEQYGVWAFFDEGMRVSSLRFDAPFRGQISGVAIGDTADCRAFVARRAEPQTERLARPHAGKEARATSAGTA